VVNLATSEARWTRATSSAIKGKIGGFKKGANVTTELIGVINAGSSSVKFTVFEDERMMLSAQVDGIGAHPKARAVGAEGEAVAPPDLGPDLPSFPSDVIPAIMSWAAVSLNGQEIAAFGHRVVHGGAHFLRPARVTTRLLSELERLVPLAPLHEPYSLAPMKAALRLHPDLPQIACFDTAFHRTMPEVNRVFGLPYAYAEEGVRRYGFHGLSYEYIASVLRDQAPDIAGGRVIVAHLGNGCSACAMSNRQSVATTMGFTALDGLPMGTRCGALDPGVILYLLQQKQMTPDMLTDLLYRRSGMLGLSGLSSDFRELLASDSPQARLAVDYFSQETARHMASLATTMGGLDGVVFTAGVGENAAPVRAAICHACAWFGLELDEAANNRHAARISTATSRVAAYVIGTNENLMIARHVRNVIHGKQD
jgi:acetate kinase